MLGIRKLFYNPNISQKGSVEWIVAKVVKEVFCENDDAKNLRLVHICSVNFLTQLNFKASAFAITQTDVGAGLSILRKCQVNDM